MKRNKRPSAPRQPNQSLINGIACLQWVATAEEPVGSRAAARGLGLEHTRVNRLLGTLASLGITEKTADGKYQPGPGLHVLAAQSIRSSRLLNAALPHVNNLLDEGLGVALGVLWRNYVCYLLSTDPGQDPIQGIGASHPYPVWDSSIGRVLLAAMPDTAARKVFVNEKTTPFKTWTEYSSVLNEIRRLGYAYIEKGNASTLSVQVGLPPVAGIAFCGDFTGRSVSRLAQLLTRAAQKISEDLVSQAHRNSN